MKAIIADDEVHLANGLQRQLALLWPELEIVSLVHDGIAAAQSLAEHKPDIAFLDIRMPGQIGLDAAHAAPANCRIVFVTAYDDHAVQAFEQAAADYLLKPVSDERLARCIHRLQQGVTLKPEALLAHLQQLLSAPVKPETLRWLRVQVGQAVRMLAVDEVCYFQSSDKYTTVITADAELLLRTPLKDLLTQLDAEYFWQVHRGTVVNVQKIEAAHHHPLGRVTLSLKERTEKLKVSRSYMHLFRQM